MSHEHEFSRAKDKIEKLTKEQTQLAHSLMKARRDEQYELERTRREYNIRINAIEVRQAAIVKELKDYERTIERLERIVKDEEKEEKEEERHRSRNRFRRIR